MSNCNMPRIDSEDIELFQRINKFGFVDMYFIYRFYKTNCKKRTVQERIRQLAKHDFLFEKKTFIPPNYSISEREGYKIIGLGNMGLWCIEASGTPLYDYSKIMKNALPYRMYHQVQLAMCCYIVENNYKNINSNFEVVRIYNEKESYLQGKNMPDAIILFKSKSSKSKGYVLVFVELERDYTPTNRITSKMNSYLMSIDEDAYSKKLGVPILQYRVLFISNANSQTQVLKEKISSTNVVEKLNVLIAKHTDINSKVNDEIYYDINNDRYIKLMGDMSK